jgi:hypothetical protein
MDGAPSTRLVALVGVVTPRQRKATHTGGQPVIAEEKMLPMADVLLIVADGEPGALLFRYTAHGELAGDTWHTTVDAAQAQADYEYGDALLRPWLEIPEEIRDAHEFAIRYAHERLNDRGRW